VTAFWGLMTEHHGRMIAALGALTLATLISLVPLYVPKLVVDTVLDPCPGRSLACCQTRASRARCCWCWSAW